MSGYFQKIKDAEALSQEDPAESLRILNNIMNETPFSPEGFQALFMFAYVCLEQDRVGMAYHIFKYCKMVQPKCVEAYVNLGMALEPYSIDLAESEFKQALALDKNCHSALGNLGLIRLRQGDPHGCIRYSQKVLDQNPTDRHCLHNLGLAKLMLRDWSGWQEYTDTLGVKHREKRDYGLPDWDFERPGQILVYAEQGLGDEIMFAALLPLLRKNHRVIFDCDARMQSIFSRSFGGKILCYGTRFKDESAIRKERKPRFQIAIGQLCSHFLKTDEDFKKIHSYRLHVDQSRTNLLRAKLQIDKTIPTIGFSFKGGLPHTGEKNRTAEVNDFEKLFEIKANFVCLDYKELSGPERDYLRTKNVFYHNQSVRKGAPLEETFAIANLCDYIVTVCTAMVYISYSIGKPTFVLVPSKPGYRYHLEGHTFPWSDNVKLYRGDFDKSIGRIKDDVTNFHRLRSKGDYSFSRFVSEHPR